MEENPEYWRKCSSCKSPIAFDRIYWVCSVSTCNRVRTGLVFCKVSCFDAHIPMMNHRDSGALEKRSPTLAQYLKERAAETEPAPGSSGPQRAAGGPAAGDSKQEILVVVSKTKDYVRAKSGFNTSDAVMAVLSDKIRGLLDDAIRRAAQDERKTILDRDFK